VLLHVGTAFVEPTDGHTYDPTDGATTDPYPAVPACPWVATDDPSVVACAMAAVLKRAKAVASPIVVSFMVVGLSCRLDQEQPHRLHDRSQPRHFLQVAIVSENRYRFRRACCSSLCERCRIKFEVRNEALRRVHCCRSHDGGSGRYGSLKNLIFEHHAFGIISVTTGLTELVTDAVVGCL
jgi:hypothetical protein